MAGMTVSLDGLMAGVETSLRSSRDGLACAYAYSLMEFAENLRLVRKGEATIEELFELYKLNVEKVDDLKARVRKERYDCMRDEPADEDDDT